MKKIYAFLVIVVLTSIQTLMAQVIPVIGNISMNQLGFAPNASKIAVIPENISGVFQTKMSV